MDVAKGDWLDEPHAEKRETAKNAALDFAQMYLIFTEGNGKKLLEHWIESVEKRDVAVNASHAEYAYWESRRAFIRGIQRQIQLAQSSGLRF